MVRISLALCGVLHVSQNTGGHSTMVWIFSFIYMLKLKSSYFLCITSMVLWGLGGGTIKFNYTILCICIQKENQNVVHVYI